MKKFSYNLLTNARIKSTLIGVVVMLQGIILIYNFNIGRLNILFVGVMTVTPLLTVFILNYFAFGQVLEPIDKTSFKTYSQLGSLRWNLKNFEGLRNIEIEQDESRYYCIVIEHDNGQKFILERHPTLDKAEERMKQLMSIWD